MTLRALLRRFPAQKRIHGHTAVGDAAHRQQTIRQLSQQPGVPAHGEDFKTPMVIEMNMHRSDDQTLMIVLNVGQECLQVTLVMIINQGDGRGDLAVCLCAVSIGQVRAYELRQGVRPVGKAVCGNQIIDFGDQFCGHAHAEASQLGVCGVTHDNIRNTNGENSQEFCAASGRIEDVSQSLPGFRPVRNREPGGRVIGDTMVAFGQLKVGSRAVVHVAIEA